MARRPFRGLNDDDHTLWQKVVRTATPLEPGKPEKSPRKPEKRKPHPAKHAPVPRFRVGEAAKLPPVKLPSEDWLSHQPVQMDRKSFDRMRRGKVSPDATIDLHGMTLAQAHPALIQFVLRAHASGRRLVLVITGKGKGGADDGPIPVRRGLLKHQVPHWLNTPPLDCVVLQISAAHQKHGGTGAYYVYLRRVR